MASIHIDQAAALEVDSATMKLHLVLLALLQHALCAQQAVSPAELQSALHSEKLEAWIESVAARRRVSKDTVRSNVQAMTYHLEPAGKDHHDAGSAAGAGGEQAKLERRTAPPPPLHAYPDELGFEVRNNRVTNNRLMGFHIECRRAHQQPPNSPFRPHLAISFWRSAGGRCRQKSMRIYCKLPNEFAPRGWDQSNKTFIREMAVPCGEHQECATFKAYSFSTNYPIQWAGCVDVEKTKDTEMVNSVPTYHYQFLCPVAPGQKSEWDMFAEAIDGIPVDYLFFTGVEGEHLFGSHSPDYLFGKKVEWRGKDKDYQPWVKFSRTGERATLRVYSHLLPLAT